jgi:uncharacterized protein YjbJ (UPF0337 family)
MALAKIWKRQVNPFRILPTELPHPFPNQKEIVMNEDTLEGKWRRLKGDVRAKWGKFTDDELEELHGDTEKLIGKLQEKYGMARDKAREELKKLEDKI